MSARSVYRDFWAGVGERFPDLAGAASTRYYSDNERRLFSEHFPALKGLRILKTDLWDEAKNTRILAWAHRQGARVFGVDISAPIVRLARAAFDTAGGSSCPLQSAVGDVRDLPFGDDSFDAIYSMGTIEHFDETVRAVEEMARVLKPGGRAIVGVPNRHDPFLRPLMATVVMRKPAELASALRVSLSATMKSLTWPPLTMPRPVLPSSISTVKAMPVRLGR